MTRGLRLRATAWLVALALFTGVVPGGLGALCAEAAEAEFIAPVGGPIVRRFEAPLGPYAAGHRGIDFGVAPGTEVVASAGGTVVFAGPVADDGLFLTIAHDEVLQTTYSFLSQISVAAGQEVSQGEAIGLSGDGHPEGFGPALHFGAKVAGHYIDPEILLFGRLDDISNLISLGPIDDEFDEIGLGAAAAGGWSPPGGKARTPEARKPWQVRLGEMVAGVGRSVKQASLGVANWTKDKVLKVGRFVGGVFEGIGNGIGTAFEGTKSFVKATGKAIGKFLGATRHFLVKVGRGLGTAIAKVGDLVVKVTRGVGRALRWVGARLADLGRGVGRLVRSLGRSFRALLRLVGSVSTIKDAFIFVGGMARGVYEQIQCSREGGATPPKIPTKEELAAGAKPPPPPNDNIVVAVAGIGSHTAEENGTMKAWASMYEMDFRTLGYSEDQVFYFSYRGLEDRGGSGPFRLHAPYVKEDTYRSIADSAALLRDQIQASHQKYPDKKIDVVAHSQGGLVAQYFIGNHYDLDDASSPMVDHFVSIATPHHGADAAQLHLLLSDNAPGRSTLRGLDSLAGRLDLPPPSVESTQEMAEKSVFISDLNAKWDPFKVKTTTISDTFDFVVTPQHTRLRGAANYTADMPGDAWRHPFSHHGRIVSATSTKEILYNALADSPSECTALRNAFADYGPGQFISTLEDTAALVVDFGTETAPLLGQVP